MIRRVINKPQKGFRLFRKFVTYHIPKNKVQVQKVADVDVKGSYLIATKKGLFEIRQESLYLLINGNFFGIARDDRFLYVFERYKPWGRILRLSFIKHVLISPLQVFRRGLSPGVHQMRVYQDKLFICDTYNNRILEISLQEPRMWQEYYPLGFLNDGRCSTNYAHINSIYIDSETIAIMSHNETQKTGNFSQIALLDRSFSVCEVIETTSGSAHDLVLYRGKWLHCDSMNGTVKLGEEVIFDAGLFTRGLTITEHYVVVGGSVYTNRKNREQSGGALFFLDKHNFKLVCRLDMPGMVQDIQELF